VSERAEDRHLEAEEVAALVDGVASDDRRAAMYAHLARCAACREEVVEAARIVRSATAGTRAASASCPSARRSASASA